ncbi:SWI/SNF and RSC complex subunit Ssr2 [Coniosporium apollinis]|uniref:SWI/SNF and RSC complex subunit Ssr2 n=1 Tax=Coniosporium apollinis TaxID=61459 RepID=A0ABQ9NWT6_9PEZI|nr:SWI/SNF and RSC complex subunit Ssr2 [Coniosporium apollinis]
MDNAAAQPVPGELTSTITAEEGAADVPAIVPPSDPSEDAVMGDGGDQQADAAIETGSNATPVVSDNPLDAPEGPRPEAEAEADAEDEEMAETRDDVKRDLPAAGGEAADGAAKEQPEQTKAAIETSARSHLISQAHAIILPSYSTWFDMHQIHNIEKKSLPEFFNSRNRSKTPAVYKDYRDFMVNTYRLNPAEYLTVTACRRNLAGDVCAIMRVHAFLEQWGLINYQVDPDTRPSNIGPPFTGHFRITADTPRGLQPHQPAPGSIITPGKPNPTTSRLASATPPTKADLNLEIRRNIYESNGKEVTPSTSTAEKPANGEASTTEANGSTATAAKTLEESLKETGKTYYCYSCGIDCTRVRYHNTKSTPSSTTGKTGASLKFDLCPSCYMNGHFPASGQASDYTKLENENYKAVPDRDAPWTDAETLLLLEGLELFDDDWNSVADHVGSRTREECVMKFLQLEIEDKYLEGEPDTSTAVNGVPTGNLGYLSNGRIPFTQADNPVMSVMGFLAGLADPAVTAAAAGKSVEEMKRALREKLERGSLGADKGKEKEKDNSAADSSAPAQSAPVKDEPSAMDIDPASTNAPQTAVATTTTPSTTTATTNSLTTLPLALTAARASALASHTERHLTALVSSAVNIELQKLSLKLSQFSELEALLQAERQDLEARREQLFLDRLAFQKRIRGVEGAFARAVSLVASGGREGVEEAGRVVREAVGEWGIQGGEGKGVVVRGVQGEGGPVGEVRPLGEGDEGFRSFEI